MIEILAAQKIKNSDIVNGQYELIKKRPMQIDRNDNGTVVYLHEQGNGVDEYCFIHSKFHDNATAMIGKEFQLNYLKQDKKVDLSYYYFAETNNAVIYLYDLKKTFAGIDVMIHLVEQWTSSLSDARFCIEKTPGYDLEADGIHLGVITENNDTERRSRELSKLFEDDPAPTGIASFVLSKHKANCADREIKRKLLSGFDRDMVTIKGVTYQYDIRTFKEGSHHMYFTDGELALQSQ